VVKESHQNTDDVENEKAVLRAGCLVRPYSRKTSAKMFYCEHRPAMISAHRPMGHCVHACTCACPSSTHITLVTKEGRLAY
jgi:hypothetical protein